MISKIIEIFSSIQGEGKYLGVQQVFVRFFECNMHCVWCDTPHSIGDTTRRFKELNLEEVLSQIRHLYRGCRSVSLTGGEPLLQKDFIKALLPLLKNEGMPSYLETNGTCPQELSEIIDDVDIVAMDIKLPSSTECRAYWQEHADFLKIALEKDVFVKTVVSSKTKGEDVIRASHLVADIDPNVLFILQPNYFDMNNGVIQKCREYQILCEEKLHNVRIIPQVHKFMKVR